MIPASLLAGKAELMDNKRGSVDFPIFTAATFLGIFFLNSGITATQTPYNTVHCWIILQQQCRNHGHQKMFWKEGLGTKELWGSRWGEMLSCPGEEQSSPKNSSAIHQQPQREFFLNECRAIFNLGTRCCSFVLVTLFMCGWRRPGEQGRAPGHVAPSWHLLCCSQ